MSELPYIVRSMPRGLELPQPPYGAVRQGESFFYSERSVVIHGLIMSGIGLASLDVERVVTRGDQRRKKSLHTPKSDAPTEKNCGSVNRAGRIPGTQEGRWSRFSRSHILPVNECIGVYATKAKRYTPGGWRTIVTRR